MCNFSVRIGFLFASASIEIEWFKSCPVTGFQYLCYAVRGENSLHRFLKLGIPIWSNNTVTDLTTGSVGTIIDEGLCRSQT